MAATSWRGHQSLIWSLSRWSSASPHRQARILGDPMLRLVARKFRLVTCLTPTPRASPPRPAAWRTRFRRGSAASYTGSSRRTSQTGPSIQRDPGVYLECPSPGASLSHSWQSALPVVVETRSYTGLGGSATGGSVPGPVVPACAEAAALGPRCQQADASRVGPVTDTVCRGPAR